jgi:hypothetical protein
MKKGMGLVWLIFWLVLAAIIIFIIFRIFMAVRG